METVKLFYEDCHLSDFQSKVVDCEEDERGYWVTLEATAFYPEGGGQACDLGTLGGSTVLDVQQRGSQIVHLCDHPLAVGSEVCGQIDWGRRLDLQQQHSGEHIVSGIICQRFGCHNVGFHVGKDVMEIDFDTHISPEMLPQIELLANEAVWKNLPVRAFYPTEDQLPTIPYRSKKALDWPVRIVEIPGYDICACCGVHVATTGEIGLIKLLSCVKFHQGVRIQMVCGKRAFLLTQEIFAQNTLVSQTFSATPRQTGATALKINNTLAELKLQVNTLQSRLFQATAQSYANTGNTVHFEENLTGSQLRELTQAIADCCGGWATVLTNADRGCNICMLGNELTRLISLLKAEFSTKGGGKPGTFQGTVLAEKEEILALLRQQR